MKLQAVFNRDGGTFKTTDMDAYCARAAEVFTGAGHEFCVSVVSGDDVVEAMQAVVDEGRAEALIAGGGDGTISAAAGICWDAGLPLGVVPAGTMNLFARSLQLPLDIWEVLDTLASADVRAVDIASVNGKPFVHQFSAGMHARMVRMRETMEYSSRLGKMRASTRAAMALIVRPPRFEVNFDIDADGHNEHRHVSAISVSNNPFGENPLFYPDDLTTGRLGIYLADPLTSAGVVHLVFDILRGKLRDNEAVTMATAKVVKMQFPKRHKGSLCVIDGELQRMPRDVEIRIHAGELKVLAP